MKRILAITPRQDAQVAFFTSLREEYKIECFNDEEAGFRRFQEQRYEFTFIDIDILKKGALAEDRHPFRAALSKYWKCFPTANVIILAEPGQIRDAVRAVKAGADDYLGYPIEKLELELVTKRVMESARARSELQYLRDRFWHVDAKGLIETRSSKMEQVFKLVKSVAPTKSTVLLTGETGVGKSLIAKLIHDHSQRSQGPFISVHCGAISDNLIESELFGHEKGAFTGAVRRKLGKFELAAGGTIFLDEIGTISAAAQISLLQILQEAVFQRVGGEADIRSDVRIIAATNENLKEMVERKEFRKDLFHRLSVFPIEIPPVRGRREDIPLLLDFFLCRLNRENGKGIRGLRPEVIDALCRYSWPGNIREMENLIERAYILETGDTLGPESFPAEVMGEAERAVFAPVNIKKPLAAARTEVLEKFEKQYLKELLTEKRGRISETARAAGLGVRQIHKLMSKYGLAKSDYKTDPPPLLS